MEVQSCVYMCHCIALPNSISSIQSCKYVCHCIAALEDKERKTHLQSDVLPGTGSLHHHLVKRVCLYVCVPVCVYVCVCQ
jgi:hypothetical protein